MYFYHLEATQERPSVSISWSVPLVPLECYKLITIKAALYFLYFEQASKFIKDISYQHFKPVLLNVSSELINFEEI
jgi:hypothetical protein